MSLDRNQLRAGEISYGQYGQVTFYNESGLIKTVQCDTEADYMRELNAGAKWADAEPKRRLGVKGVRFARSTEDFCDAYQTIKLVILNATGHIESRRCCRDHRVDAVEAGRASREGGGLGVGRSAARG